MLRALRSEIGTCDASNWPAIALTRIHRSLRLANSQKQTRAGRIWTGRIGELTTAQEVWHADTPSLNQSVIRHRGSHGHITCTRAQHV
eukprot:11130356-Alexandrium_andersonii.AAC.1